MDRKQQKPPLPALVIDGTGSSTFVGVLGPEAQWLARQNSGAAPLESLFETVERVLEDAEIDFDSLQAYVYSEGPGSVLGLRLCAMAIETWSRLYPQSAKRFAYNSLQLAAGEILQKQPSIHSAYVISDWKKDLWNGVEIRRGRIAATKPVPITELSTFNGSIFHLPARKGWQDPPEFAKTIRANPHALPELLHWPDLLKATESVQLYNAGANTFQKWTAKRHPPLDPPTA